MCTFLNLFFREASTSLQLLEGTESDVVKIDASKTSKNTELSKIIGEMSLDEFGFGGDGNDLLDLMDS